jgi:nanoRNase/pAp phosphatase (c-di-AMP/oligoRNAs hydrolase)
MKRIEAILIKEETIFNVFKLKSMIHENDSLAILMYGSPDPDAVASALALQEIVRKLGGLSNSILVATEPVVRQQNLDFIKAMRVSIQLLDKVDLAQYRLLAIVDAQPSFFGDALGEFKPQIVIVHHPCATVWHAQVADVRPSYGSLSTILTEYLLAAKIRISRKLHTALLYGIKADTSSFEREVSLEDIGAYYLNFAKANRELIRRIEMNQIPERYLKYYDYAYHNRHRWRDRIVSFLGRVESADVCVQVADFFLRVVYIY